VCYRARWVLTTSSAKQLLAKGELAADEVVDGDSLVGQQWSCAGRLIRSAAEESKLEQQSSQEKKPWKIIRRSGVREKLRRPLGEVRGAIRPGC
jgi:hypothetical protein